MASSFTGTIQFLDKLGIYNVVLPFLLIFTMVFAILEKSKIFGMDEFEGVKYTKKNLNSMFAFVTALLVIASSRLVAAINEALANMTLLMLLGVSFLLLAGTFHTGEKEFEIEGYYKSILVGLMFVGIFLIFLHALKTESGIPWSLYLWEWLKRNFDTSSFGALILAVLTILLMLFVTGDPRKSNSKSEES